MNIVDACPPPRAVSCLVPDLLHWLNNVGSLTAITNLMLLLGGLFPGGARYSSAQQWEEISGDGD